MTVDRCPIDPDTTAEAYLQGTLDWQEAETFEDHYLACPRCSERLQFTQHFVLAAQRAVQSMVGRAVHDSQQAARAAVGLQ